MNMNTQNAATMDTTNQSNVPTFAQLQPDMMLIANALMKMEEIF